MFKQTGNVEVVRQLLGHGSISSTSNYLGISAEEAVQMALKVEI